MNNYNKLLFNITIIRTAHKHPFKMRAVLPMNTLLAVFFLILSGCQQHTDQINMVVLKGSLQASPTPPKTNSISDHNNRYKSVPIEQSSGNPLRDALDALFADNELEQYYSSLQLSSTAREADRSVYHFRGKAKSKTQLAKAGFTESFVVSIGRNEIGLNYSIEFID